MKITQRIIFKQFSLIPLFFVAIILFSNNSIAQEVKAVVAQAETLLAQNQTTAEDELQKEFDEILSNYIKEKNGKQVYYGIDGDGQKQLIPLYEKMNETQKSKQIVRYRPGLEKHVPSKEEFETWKNPSQFGVWLNNKRISNEELNNLKYSDIAYFDKSRLAKNAKNYGKHVYQLNALTNSNFEEYNHRLKTEPYLVFWPKNKKVVLRSMENEESKITNELELRKAIAKHIKYPAKERENKIHGTVELFVNINEKGKVSNLEKEPKGNVDIKLEEVVVTGYMPNNEKTPSSNNDSESFRKEVKRVVNKLPLIGIPEYYGKTVGVKVTFGLQ